MTDFTGYQYMLFSQLDLEKPQIRAMNSGSAVQKVTDVTPTRRWACLCCTFKS